MNSNCIYILYIDVSILISELLCKINYVCTYFKLGDMSVLHMLCVFFLYSHYTISIEMHREEIHMAFV